MSCELYFFIKTCWKCFFPSSIDLASTSTSIISSHVIAESSIILAKYLPCWQLHVAGFQILSFSDTWRFLNSHRLSSLFHHWSELHFYPSNFHLHLHDISFVKIFDSFFPVIMIKTCIFKSCFIWNTYSSR